MDKSEFLIGLAMGCGFFGILLMIFFVWALHIYEKVNKRFYSNYADRIEAAVLNLERKAAEK